MKLIQTKIPDVVVIEPQVFGDDRGWFMESFNEKRFHDELTKFSLAVPCSFVQDNHSCSNKGVLRGLHFQAAPYAQGKLVRVVKGSAFDVAVDIRKDSATYGQYVSCVLSEYNQRMFWVPEGFAHGFLALEDDTHFIYKATDYYNRDCERAIAWNDAELNISWPKIEGLEEFFVSEKDSQAPVFKSY